jgi:hypothetical protein
MANLKSGLMLFSAILVIGYLYFYTSRKVYANTEAFDYQVEVTMEKNDLYSKPYITRKIENVDDYEYNIVFKNEGNREVSENLRNKLNSKFPMDWVNLPPNSARFQEGDVAPVLEQYKDMGMDTPYDNVDTGYQPPDEDAEDAEEKKILATYVPKRSEKTPGTYDIEDAKELIDKIYEKRGLRPEVVAMPNNVYQVVGTQEINPKIVWEDQAPVQFGGAAATTSAGEQTIQVPYNAGDPDKALDPYFDKSSHSNLDRWDYREWTPGLERMFGPTQPQAAWY